MSVKNVEKAFDLISKFFAEEELFFGGKMPKEIVDKAEKDIGITFPHSYRTFLEKYGYGGVNSLDINGVTQYNFQDSGQGGVVWRILEERKSFSFPFHLIPIYDVGEGTTYCLDTSQMNEEGECPVVAWPIGGYEQTPILEVIAKDFGEFFLNKVKEQIDLKNNG